MIAQLSGRLIHKSPTRVILDVNGVGYDVLIPLSTYEKLSEEGENNTLLTYLHVREEALQLYGFSTSEERKLFQQLIAISGVGPKVAQGILSGCSVETFCDYIRNNEISSLKNIPGIGKKTAERLVVEMRDRIKHLVVSDTTVKPMPAESAEAEEAVMALVSLGYSRNAAEKAIQRASQEHGKLPLEELIKRSLRNF